jgi:hypothetical protein
VLRRGKGQGKIALAKTIIITIIMTMIMDRRRRPGSRHAKV